MGSEICRCHSGADCDTLRILLTGATSLTGFWFARQLKDSGHTVKCLMTRNSAADYTGLKSAIRFSHLQAEFPLLYNAAFGTEAFQQILEAEEFDLLCLHGSHIPEYKSQSFNIAESLFHNLHNINDVFAILQRKKNRILLTGTLFEPNEGLDGKPAEAGSPYGLAKGLITQAFRYYSIKFTVPMRHFVVANPFGPLEDRKFNYYLMDCWLNGKKAQVKTPDYVRDNIPVTLLALAYEKACRDLMGQANLFSSTRPSGYVGTQAKFTALMAEHMRGLLHIPCEFECLKQIDFLEPMDRHNSENAFVVFPEFSEETFWSEYSHYYCELKKKC